MGQEINLMKNYPRTNRDIKQRGTEKTNKDRELARKFEKDFFDGDRKTGYGGFIYDSKYWTQVVRDIYSY